MNILADRVCFRRMNKRVPDRDCEIHQGLGWLDSLKIIYLKKVVFRCKDILLYFLYFAFCVSDIEQKSMKCCKSFIKLLTEFAQ